MARLIVHNASLVWTGTVGRGGHIMATVQWLEGLRRLGHEVLYYDRLEDKAHGDLFAEIIDRWWDPGHAAALLPSGEAAYGLDAGEVEAFAKDAAGIIALNPTFSAAPDWWVERVRPRVLIDMDPGFNQIWAVEADRPEDVLGDHDLYYTVGPNIGTSRSRIPTLGIDWRPIWNPVLSDWWDPTAPRWRDRFTTITGLWMGKYQYFEGTLWGPKAEQLARFLELPSLVGEPIEIAVESGSGDDVVHELERHGWVVRSADEVAATADTYRDYVLGSGGEFGVAKGLYVGTRSAWFSDRSACFLAAGRPVVVQDTGIADVLPTGEGLFPVSSVEEAAAAIREIRRDYERHSRAARQIALDHLDAGRVLPRLLSDMGVDRP